MNSLIFGDVHLGHPTNPTAEIIQKLYHYLGKEIDDDLDVIFCEGDLFDGLFYYNDDELKTIELWVLWLLVKCRKHNVKVRVLEGTPSHDMRQNMVFERMNAMLDTPADIKYFDDLTIEYIEDLDINVLYLPDERAEADKSLIDAKNLMAERGLKQVDFAVMHGMFDYQLPNIPDLPKHNSQQWLPLVKHLIFIGHIHTHSQYDKIIATGSFDRLAHNEEETKGYTKVSLTKKGCKIDFIANEKAKVYKTIDVTECVDAEKAYLKGISEINAVGTNEYTPRFRLKAKKEQVFIDALLERLKLQFKNTAWDRTKIVKEIDDTKKPSSSLDIKTFVPIQITPTNITSLLQEKLNSLGKQDDVSTRAVELLKEIVNG